MAHKRAIVSHLGAHFYLSFSSLSSVCVPADLHTAGGATPQSGPPPGTRLRLILLTPLQRLTLYGAALTSAFHPAYRGTGVPRFIPSSACMLLASKLPCSFGCLVFYKLCRPHSEAETLESGHVNDSQTMALNLPFFIPYSCSKAPCHFNADHVVTWRRPCPGADY